VAKHLKPKGSETEPKKKKFCVICTTSAEIPPLPSLSQKKPLFYWDFYFGKCIMDMFCLFSTKYPFNNQDNVE
jgi:hypothetical protein